MKEEEGEKTDWEDDIDPIQVKWGNEMVVRCAGVITIHKKSISLVWGETQSRLTTTTRPALLTSSSSTWYIILSHNNMIKLGRD